MRDLVWWSYADREAYRREPSRRRWSELRARLDRPFRRRTGLVVLDRLLERLHAVHAELQRVLDRQRGAPAGLWLARMLVHEPQMLAAVSLANKTARVVSAPVVKGGIYRAPVAAA